MTERVDQRICIKFCFKLGHSSAETIPMIKKAFGDDSMSEAQIKLWYRRFKDGRESVESDQRSGRPSTSRTPENVESVRAAINEDRRMTVRELEEDLGIPRTVVSRILTEDLGKKRVAANLFHGSCHKSRKNFVLK
jgi:transposase